MAEPIEKDEGQRHERYAADLLAAVDGDYQRAFAFLPALLTIFRDEGRSEGMRAGYRYAERALRRMAERTRMVDTERSVIVRDLVALAERAGRGELQPGTCLCPSPTTVSGGTTWRDEEEAKARAEACADCGLPIFRRGGVL